MWFRKKTQFEKYATSNSPVDILVAQLSVLVGGAKLLSRYSGCPGPITHSFSTYCTNLQLEDGRVLVLGKRWDVDTYLALTNLERAGSTGHESECNHEGSTVKRTFTTPRDYLYSRYNGQSFYTYAEWSPNGMDNIPGVTKEHCQFLLDTFNMVRDKEVQQKAAEAILKIVADNNKLIERNNNVSSNLSVGSL